MDRIVHICRCADWLGTQAGSAYRATSLETEGFIHCSRPDQALKVVNMFLQHIPNLCLMWISPEKLIAELRWEAVEDDQFPHLYGELNLDAVIGVLDFKPDADGVYRTLPEI